MLLSVYYSGALVLKVHEWQLYHGIQKEIKRTLMCGQILTYLRFFLKWNFSMSSSLILPLRLQIPSPSHCLSSFHALFPLIASITIVILYIIFIHFLEGFLHHCNKSSMRAGLLMELPEKHPHDDYPRVLQLGDGNRHGYVTPEDPDSQVGENEGGLLLSIWWEVIRWEVG